MIEYLWKKKIDHHEGSHDEFHSNYDNENFNGSYLLEADSNDGNQLCHPIKLIYFIQQQPVSGVIENKGSKICSSNP